MMNSADAGEKLKYLYLCNHIVQQCKKRAPEYHDAFRPVVTEAFTLTYR